jgi:hypothetical protein
MGVCAKLHSSIWQTGHNFDLKRKRFRAITKLNIISVRMFRKMKENGERNWELVCQKQKSALPHYFRRKF